jgi:hypothetical protein
MANDLVPPRAAGCFDRIWRALAIAYTVTGIALHVVFGVFFSLGYGTMPWWFVTLMMLAWAALWVPAIWLLRRAPRAIAFLAVFGDTAILIGFAAIADAAGWM